MDERSAAQLEAMARLDRLFRDHGIDYWIFGGWAVDVHVGRVTRPHDDLDFAVWLHDLGRIREVLESDGWTHVPSDEDDGGTSFSRDDLSLGLMYLERVPTGGPITRFSFGQADWTPEHWADDEGELGGIRLRVIGLEPLRAMKAFRRGDADDEAKDDHDLSVLAELS